MNSECTISTVLPEAPDAYAPTPLPPELPPLTRARAAIEVLICSGYPTQLLAIAMLRGFGVRPGLDGTLSPAFLLGITALDTILLLSLVFFFIKYSDETPRQIFLNHEQLRPELQIGIVLVPVVFVVVIGLHLGLRLMLPSLHNVETSPFQALLESPWLLVGFVALVLIGGGVREELQRAFLLHRFEQRLGGGRVGLILTSLAFGLGHTVQGWDAAVVTTLMGAFWGALYLARRSVVSTVTNHALFNSAQVALAYAALPVA